MLPSPSTQCMLTFFQLSLPLLDLISPGLYSFIPKTLPHFWHNPRASCILEGLSSWRGCHRVLAQELWSIRPLNVVLSHTHTSHFPSPQLPPFSSTGTGTYVEVCIIPQIQPLGALKYITTTPVLLKDPLVLDMFIEIFTELYTLSAT